MRFSAVVFGGDSRNWHHSAFATIRTDAWVKTRKFKQPILPRFTFDYLIFLKMRHSQDFLTQRYFSLTMAVAEQAVISESHILEW